MSSGSTVKVSFPHLGSYWVPIEVLFTEGLGVEYISPPPITKRTLEIGSKYSPDFVCAPFKYNLGNFIETIERGANTIAQVGGACRLGYYGELHEQIIRDLGYNVKFINMARASFSNPLSFYESFKEVNPDLKLKHVAKTLMLVLNMVKAIDAAEDFLRKNIGFEVNQGEFEKTHAAFLSDLRKVRDKKQLLETIRMYKKAFRSIEIDKPKNPLKVGIIGEYYTIMEPYSNHYIEKELATRGIEVERWMNISNSVIHYPKKEIHAHIKPYVKYNMGATSMATISKAVEFAKRGFDGLIHVKSFGCTPEVDAMPVLQNISSDLKIPILYFSFDSQTGEEGIKTRLEAFYDMIIMRKESTK